jgi:hypothetical protein
MLFFDQAAVMDETNPSGGGKLGFQDSLTGPNEFPPRKGFLVFIINPE